MEICRNLWKLVEIGCLIFTFYLLPFTFCCYAEEIKQPNVSGRFYPANPQELSWTIEKFLLEAKTSQDINGDILAIISPHAGYEFAGKTAAYGYKAIKGRHYDTVIILGPSHYVNFKGASIWPKGAFRTPLGEISTDESLSYDLMLSSSKFCSYPEAFSQEHSVEVQLPFLQTVLKNFKIVPIILGNNNFSDCQNLANAISEVIKEKKCLLVASSDMYHGFNYLDGEIKDLYTLSLIRQLKPRELYERIQIQDAELCGWQGVIISILVANRLGYEKAKVLDYTNSAKVTGTKRIGEYCVGYGSVVIYKGNSPDNKSARQRGNGSTNSPSFDEPSRATLRLVSLAQGHPERSRGTQSKDKLLWAVSEANNGGAMLNEKQRKRLLEIARKSIESYLVTGKKLELTENDPVLSEQCGAFVTLRLHNELRGCIGNIIGNQPLYLTVRDMAVEAAVNDPRFMPVTEKELKSVIIEISVLSPLEKIDNPDKIELGVHGVLIKRGYRSGVFLPQVATETGWSKNEFLSNLCAHKAGLSPLAWKDPSTEIYIFTAEVFSE